jgi:uncharacterized membrane protein
MEKFILSLPEWLGITVCVLISTVMIMVFVGAIVLAGFLMFKFPVLLVMIPIGFVAVPAGFNVYKEMKTGTW